MNLLVVPVVIGCTSLVTALGVAALAAHTIVRQIWDFWTSVSQCLNISAQTMIAGALGKVSQFWEATRLPFVGLQCHLSPNAGVGYTGYYSAPGCEALTLVRKPAPPPPPQPYCGQRHASTFQTRFSGLRPDPRGQCDVSPLVTMTYDMYHI